MGSIITTIRGKKDLESVREEFSSHLSRGGSAADIFSVVSAKKAATILGVEVDTVMRERRDMVGNHAQMTRVTRIIRECGFCLG